MLLIVVQLFQVAYSSYIMLLKTKKNMLINMFISNALSLCVFFIAGLESAFWATITITIRSFLFTFREKYKTNFVLYFCLLLHILPGILSFNGLVSLLPCLTAIIAVLVIWFGNEQQIRIGLVVPNSIWFIYYLICGIYISATFSLISIVVELISFYKNKYDVRCEGVTF